MQLPELLNHISNIALSCGRDPQSIRLVAVSKQRSPEIITEKILQYGHWALAENKGQELRDKQAILSDPRIEWHFIGPLQRNKIKYVQHVSLLHTLENLAQAEVLSLYAEKWGHAPKVLIQVHNGEAQKHGCPPEQVPHLLRQTRELGLHVSGLMVMAQYGNIQAAQQTFRNTALLNQDLGLPELSMGMSDDYTQAIHAGATILRIGSVLFQ